MKRKNQILHLETPNLVVEETLFFSSSCDKSFFSNRYAGNRILYGHSSPPLFERASSFSFQPLDRRDLLDVASLYVSTSASRVGFKIETEISYRGLDDLYKYS